MYTSSSGTIGYPLPKTTPPSPSSDLDDRCPTWNAIIAGALDKKPTARSKFRRAHAQFTRPRWLNGSSGCGHMSAIGVANRRIRHQPVPAFPTHCTQHTQSACRVIVVRVQYVMVGDGDDRYACREPLCGLRYLRTLENGVAGGFDFLFFVLLLLVFCVIAPAVVWVDENWWSCPTRTNRQQSWRGYRLFLRFTTPTFWLVFLLLGMVLPSTERSRRMMC